MSSIVTTLSLAPPRSFRLDGRTALITGASRNIGLAIATAFAHAGADLVLVARERERLERVVAALSSTTGAKVCTVAADVATESGLSKIFDAIPVTSVDVLVNNAHTLGVSRGDHLIDAGDGQWHEVMSTNLLAPFRLIRKIAPGMMQRRGGSIINLMSGSGLQPSPGLGAYGASKAALWMMTRTLAGELAPHIRVNALCPGLVSEDGEPRNDAQHQLLASVPMGRIADPNEIAGAALYLASPDSSYTTGSLIVVNGGRTW